jgi:truncated hemoglobin YjbI
MRKLSFSIEGDDQPSTPLYAKIGEKCLITLAEILYELINEDDLLKPIFAKSDQWRDPNMLYHYILHITNRKPYDVCKMRNARKELAFRTKHFNQLIKLLGLAMGIMAIKETVIIEVLKAALTTKQDFKEC